MTNKTETNVTPINSAMGDALQRAAEQNNAKTILEGKKEAAGKPETSEKPQPKKRVTQKSRAEDAIKSAIDAKTYEEVKQILTLHGAIIKKVKGAAALKKIQDLAEQMRQEELAAETTESEPVIEEVDPKTVKTPNKAKVVEEANVTPITDAKKEVKPEGGTKPKAEPKSEGKKEEKVEKSEPEIVEVNINNYILPSNDDIKKTKLSQVLRIDLMKVFGNKRIDVLRSVALELTKKCSVSMNSTLSDFYYGR